MTDGRHVFDQPVKVKKEHPITFENLQVINEMIIQVVAC